MPAILPAAQFSLRDQAKRTGRIANRKVLTDNIEAFIDQAEVIEPTADEIATAAALEEAALQASVQLDTGESQLVAILVSRALPLILTGDKRAVIAVNVISVSETGGRVACLEQLMLAIFETTPLDAVRVKVCAEPNMDKALMICFACSSLDVSLENVRACLESYINNLRRESGLVLLDGQLSAVIS